MTQQTTPSTARRSTSIRETAEYKRILAKFVQQIEMRPDWSVTLHDLDRGVRQMMAQHNRTRKARLVKCPCCGIKRRDPSYEHCAPCGREASREDLRQSKDKSPKPSKEKSEQLAKELLAKQQTAACEELYLLWRDGCLPPVCEVASETDTELRIKTPMTLFVLDLTNIREAEKRSTPPVPSTPKTGRVYGSRRRRRKGVPVAA